MFVIIIIIIIIIIIYSQVCSAIHNQEYTLIEDYITGLKCLLYLQVWLED